MKVHYDEEVDALYLELSDQKADGVIEIAEGINIETAAGANGIALSSCLHTV